METLLDTWRVFMMSFNNSLGPILLLSPCHSQLTQKHRELPKWLSQHVNLGSRS